MDELPDGSVSPMPSSDFMFISLRQNPLCYGAGRCESCKVALSMVVQDSISVRRPQ